MNLLKERSSARRVNLFQNHSEDFGPDFDNDNLQTVLGEKFVSDFEQEELLSEILGQQLRRLHGGVENHHRLKPRWLYDF